MKLRNRDTKRDPLAPDQAFRIQWRGVRLAHRVYRAFCGKCGTHMEAPSESEARRMDLLCRHCVEDREIQAEVDRLVQGTRAANTCVALSRVAIGGGTPYTVIDETEGYQSNAIREMEDVR